MSIGIAADITAGFVEQYIPQLFRRRKFFPVKRDFFTISNTVCGIYAQLTIDSNFALFYESFSLPSGCRP
jgi:hypothetical protein